MFSQSRVAFSLLGLLILFFLLPTPVFATDDSNAGSLSLSTTTTAVTISSTTNATITALDQLSQGINDTQYTSQGVNSTRYQQLLNQLNGEVKTGNNAAAAQTLSQLKDFTNSPQGQGLPPSLKDLIQSTIPQSNGMMVDTSLFLQKIGDPNANGMPVGLNGMNPLTASQNLSTLSGLFQGIDPNSAQTLSQDSIEIHNSILSGLLPGATPPSGFQPGTTGLQSPQLPKLPPVGINGLGGAGSNHLLPSAPPISSAASGLAFSLATLNPATLAPIILVVAVAVALVLLRKQLLNLSRRRITPKSQKAKPGKPEKPDLGLNLKNPRDLIIFYFRKAVGAMHKRGLPRLQSETHREYSTKCSTRPEAEHISPLSSLYEKAMFSGRETTHAEAHEAREHAMIVEKGPRKSSSEGPSLAVETVEPALPGG